MGIRREEPGGGIVLMFVVRMSLYRMRLAASVVLALVPGIAAALR